MTSTFAGPVLAAVLLAASAAHAIAQEPTPSKGTTASAASATGPALNLNTASVAQLEALPGVGARVAQRIVEYRTKNGGFKKVEDLMKVQGIGERSFLRLKPLITVAPAKSDGPA
jgi:competence protein ComEA